MTMWILLAAGLTAFSSSYAKAVTEQPLSLRHAIEVAIARSPQLESARRQAEARVFERRSAFAKLLPTLDLAATHGLQNNVPIASNNAYLASNPSAPWYSSLSLALSETLYDNGVSLTDWGNAERQEAISAIQREKAIAELKLKVGQEFVRYSAAKHVADFKRKQLELMQAQYTKIEAQFRQGFRLPADFLRIKAQVQRAEIDVINADTVAANLRVDLLKVLGVDEAGQSEIQFRAMDLVSNSDRLGKWRPLDSVLTSVQEHYDFRVGRLQEEVAKTQVTLAERRYYPRIQVTGGLTYSNFGYVGSSQAFSASNQMTWNALVTVSHNFWDWGIRKNDIAVAQATQDASISAIRATRQDLVAQSLQLQQDRRRLLENHRLAEALVGMEEASTRDIEHAYREGRATYLDLSSGYSNVLDARVGLVQVRSAVLQSELKSLYLEGKLHEVDFDGT